MTDRNEHDNTSQAAVAAINRSIQAVTAEISARRNEANHADTTKETGDSSPRRPPHYRKQPTCHVPRYGN